MRAVQLSKVVVCSKKPYFYFNLEVLLMILSMIEMAVTRINYNMLITFRQTQIR